MKTTFKFLTLFLGLSFGLKAQSLDEIVAKHIEAIGGQANWAKLSTLKTECKLNAQGSDIIITLWQVDKKSLRQNISLAGMTGYSIIKNTEGWSYAPWAGHTKPEAMTADDVKNSQDQLYIQDEFLTYKELGKKIEYFGKDDIDGTECHKIKMTGKDGKETTFYLDASNFLVIKETEKMVSDGKVVESSTFYSDYQKLEGGIVYPMSIMGEWGEMTITKLEINPKIDEALFTLPK